jgi:subtilisin-like proprotein convertase family protein
MKKFLLSMSILVTTYIVYGQSLWQQVDEKTLSSRTDDVRTHVPKQYKTFALESTKMIGLLAKAPMEFTVDVKDIQSRIELPMPDGRMEKFVFWEAPSMEPGLMAQYPNIKSYRGYLEGNPTVVTRFTMTPDGFHASIVSNEGTTYIDPYLLRNSGNYISYNASDYVDEYNQAAILCGTDEAMLHAMNQDRPMWGMQERSLGDKMEFRKYRLALACTGEWGNKRVTKEKALQEMVEFIDRANVVFEKEVALRLVIIEGNDKLIFLDALNDPYNTPTSGLNTVGGHTQILNTIIGGANYDVGHVFMLCNDVGGVAAGQICTSGGKGNGVTCYGGNSAATGPVSTFNHEVGHQMTASHTFNNCPGNEGQTALETGYEPGSGSTIMSYSGACGSSNLGVARENYYHSGTLEQMLFYTNTASSEAYRCATKTDVGNFIPEITLDYKNGFYIPQRTPFVLTGSAVDQNNDAMTYVWEQIDNQTSSPLGMPTGNAPLFRSVRASTDPQRLFPNKGFIFGKIYSDVTELMPTYGREMNFRFTVRDNNPQANAVAFKDIKFNVAANADSFVVTEPANSVKWKSAKAYTVKWDVANTNIAPVNAKFVDIYIAYKNSLNFNSADVIRIAENVPNNGEAKIVIPPLKSNATRIIVRGAGNIFFSTSANIQIEDPDGPAHYSDVTLKSRFSCLPTPVSFDFTTKGLVGLTDKIKFEVVSGLPAGAVATWDKLEVNPGEPNTLSLNLDNLSGKGEYLITVRTFVPGIDTIERNLLLMTNGTDLNNVPLIFPAATSLGLPSTQRYEWAAKQDALEYTMEVSKTPMFRPEDIVITRTTAGLVHVSEVYLEKAAVYYWRVKSKNDCKEGEWSKVSAFTIEALECKTYSSGILNLPISTSGTTTIEAPLNILDEGTVSDINVKGINVIHSRDGDLSVELISPKGTVNRLWTKRCGTQQNVRLGLDDQSNLFMQCPINTGRIYRPENALSKFNGEQLQGRWTLRVLDETPGGGGTFTNWDLETCGQIALNPPVLTRNNRLLIAPKDKRTIERTLLLAEDANNNTNEITFTIVEEPKRGVLVLNGVPLEVGNTYTQEQIDLWKLEYIHTADDEEEDLFSFIISDGQGGFVLVNDFVIEVDAAFPSSLGDAEILSSKILVYPNPTSSVFNIEHVDSKSQWTAELLDLNGRVVIQKMTTQSDHIIMDLGTLSSGIYFAKIQADGRKILKKVVKTQ